MSRVRLELEGEGMSAYALASTDRDIVARMRSGDRDAFAELVRRHNRTLFRTARSIRSIVRRCSATPFGG
jgi:hypothetical protein